MPYIELEDHLPGITGLLEYRRDTAEPIRDLTQLLLRGPSTLSEGERELIATVVSHGNQCQFCTTAHAAVTNVLLGESDTVEAVKKDIETAPLSEKIKALLSIASLVQKSGKLVTEKEASRAKAAGATDLEIHDTVLIAALFSMYNRYVDGLATNMPAVAGYFDGLADRLTSQGYVRNPAGYDYLRSDANTSKL